ncbi:MAG: cupin domain-containing protein [Selenomonadaceae bacterium]|nr:cupin domain-containing protein [Selenomonadaceae bacterium]
MAFIEPRSVQAKEKAGGKGEITITHLLTPDELKDKCSMFAKVTLPPGTSIGTHRHTGNTETYHILSGEALYNDNGTEKKIGVGVTTYCPDGEEHGIANPSADNDLVFIALIIQS